MFHFVENSDASFSLVYCHCGQCHKLRDLLHHQAVLSGAASMALLAALPACTSREPDRKRWDGMYAVPPVAAPSTVGCLDDDNPAPDCH